jgi:hypothetical protein
MVSPNGIELKKVSRFGQVELHVGNKPKSVRGCFAVGTDRETEATLPAGAQPAQQDWAAFLDHPTTENYRRIAKILDSCGSDSCKSEVAPSSASVVKLVGLVQKGERQAIDLAFLCRRFLDGGDLEDVTRSLGMVR